MSRFRTFHWLCVILTVGLALTLFGLFTTGAAVRASVVERPLAQSTPEPGDVIEVFNNAWMYQSSLGMVYDPDRGIVRYAHESQSSAKRPTIFDVDPVAHTAVLSFALSAKNSNWRWQIDNRDGAGYDYVAKTYFLPDYNGDKSYADDNIVEIDRDGNIRNAWEMDNEVGSNDSADGSKINNILDIAVVPGSPNRYFVTAAYDDNLVYEVVLTRTGQLWKSKTWATLAKCTVPGLTDNLGIDYDAQYNRLYHSDWKSNKIVVTDLTCDDGQPMNVITEFTCPGAGGYNSGVTFIEGSDPPEIWVTDFNKNKTTRCVAVGGGAPEPGWKKMVDGVLWTAELNHTTETSATFQVTDIITAGRPFTLTERWDADRLRVTGVQVEPPLAAIVTATGALTVTGDAATPEIMTVTKQFLTLPCTWTETVVSESLTIEAGDNYAVFAAEKPFTVTKTAPVLQIGASPASQNVYIESAAHFTLYYTNTGGFENAVVITGAFPVTAPFLYAEPEPDATADDRSWARWDVGDLAQNDSGQITVYVYAVDSTAEPLTVTHRIHNHVGEVAAETETILHVTGETTPGWTKTIDDGSGPVVWSPTLSLTLETGDIFTATDMITVNESFILNALWLTSELTLKSWDISPVSYESSVSVIPGALNFGAPISSTFFPRPIILTKVFTVNTCSWPQTVLLESLQIGTNLPILRPVLIHKDAPILTLTATQAATEAHGGEVVTYTLAYTNSGAYENQFTVRADFPVEASFESADPAPTTHESGVVTWLFPDGLNTGDSGMITVTAQITDEIPPVTRVTITNTLLDHANVPKAVASVACEIEPPEWEKRVNGGAWDTPVSVEAGEEFTVTEVITTGASLILVDRWPEAHLTLLTYTHSAGAGDIVTAAGRLTWTVDVAAPETVTLTKRFRTEVFTTAYTVLWEDLSVGGAEWERRAVILERAIPDMRLTKTAAPGVAQPGERITYTLTFSNAGKGTARGVILTDIIPISITNPISHVAFTDHASRITATSGVTYVWQIADLAPNAGGVITITGVLSQSLPASLLTNEAEIAAANQAQVGGASPGEDNRITAAASIAVDGDPLVCTLAPISGTTHAFCNGICGAVTFVNTGTVSSLTIMFTQRFPSTGGEGLPRQYHLEANGSGFTARLTLCYADEELDIAGIPAGDAGELRAFRYKAGGLWEASSGQTVNSGDNTITIEGVTQFSAWGIGIPGEEQPTAVRQRKDLSGLINLTGLGAILLAPGLALLVLGMRKRQQ
ncbi:MAG: DUF11 domain-containing protein [Anaerolineae bacterium]